ncbi:MAG: lipopolysaccharide biosynthesis protein RfbH [Candidatus Gastranaerophilales bacterium]|nr:lipopolysaccharide biosynthesis protein RfbH [Candidatus Gastranaerophilales bacterium]
MKKTIIEKILRNAIKLTSKLYFNTVNPNKRNSDYIPASGKVLDDKDLSNLIDASLDMWLTTGRFNDEFEKKLADYLGVKYILTTNSGSSANLLALSALTSHKLGERRLKKDDEVITVAAGFPTTINPIIQNGLIPVFVDVEIGTYNINPDLIEESITEKTRAIFIAHTLGNPFNIDKILEICQKHNLWLIEDNCDALGSKYKDKYTGSFGHIGTLSFYPAHHITMGEGGALITSDSNLYRIIMSYRDWGRDCWCPPGKDNTCKNRFNMQLGNLPFGYDHKYTYSHTGYNLKITDWQAAIGLSQLAKLDKFVKKRKENFKLLFEGLKEFEDYLILPEIIENADPSWFGFLITIKENSGFNKIDLCKYLEDNKIGTRQLFAGNILRQPAFVDDNIKLKISNSTLLNSQELKEEHYKLLPNTDIVMNSTFWTGVWPGMTEKDINYIINKFRIYFHNKK